MTPAARLQAACLCLDDILDGTAAEKTLTTWGRKNRYAGSKDRAAVRDHVFDALRQRDTLAARGGALTGRGLILGLATQSEIPIATLFSGDGYGPEPLTEDEHTHLDAPAAQAAQWDMPDWCAELLRQKYGAQALDIAWSLTERAPVDLRVNLRKISRDAAQTLLAEQGIETLCLDIAPTALRVQSGARQIKNSAAYSDGLVELQDAGSQALACALPLTGGMRVLDFCAGGGGKSLAMADLQDIQVFAHDAEPQRMKDIAPRAKRAGVEITQLTTDTLAKSGLYDLILCDVPCSGSGAWRRSPDGKWRLGQAEFQDLLNTQAEILEQAKAYLAPGGTLAYATCSLFAPENEAQIDKFQSNNPADLTVIQSQWTPLDGCDGFFLAQMT
jgi:16S rRNA (cytosine967-C5)-methyltransferase